MVRLMSLVATALLLPAVAAQSESTPRSLAGHYELGRPLHAGLSARDDAVRARSAFLLGRIGDREAARRIRPRLDDPSIAVRYQAGIALCALGDPSGLSAASAALASAADWIRYYAVHSLAELCTDRARATLEAQRPHQTEFIRAQIDEVLETWPWPSVPPRTAEDKMGPHGSLVELFEDAADVLVVESDVYWHRGEHLQCVRCNEAAIFLDPHYVDLYGTSAWLLWSQGVNQRAVSLLHQGLAANPTAWDMWFDAGYQYVLLQQHATAARFLGRAVELGAPEVQSRQYCHALEKSGRPDLALEAWKAQLSRFPEDPIAPGNVARLTKVLGTLPPNSGAP